MSAGKHQELFDKPISHFVKEDSDHSNDEQKINESPTSVAKLRIEHRRQQELFVMPQSIKEKIESEARVEIVGLKFNMLFRQLTTRVDNSIASPKNPTPEASSTTAVQDSVVDNGKKHSGKSLSAFGKKISNKLLGREKVKKSEEQEEQKTSSSEGESGRSLTPNINSKSESERAKELENHKQITINSAVETLSHVLRSWKRKDIVSFVEQLFADKNVTSKTSIANPEVNALENIKINRDFILKRIEVLSAIMKDWDKESINSFEAKFKDIFSEKDNVVNLPEKLDLSLKAHVHMAIRDAFLKNFIGVSGKKAGDFAGMAVTHEGVRCEREKILELILPHTILDSAIIESCPELNNLNILCQSYILAAHKYNVNDVMTNGGVFFHESKVRFSDAIVRLAESLRNFALEGVDYKNLQTLDELTEANDERLLSLIRSTHQRKISNLDGEELDLINAGKSALGLPNEIVSLVELQHDVEMVFSKIAEKLWSDYPFVFCDAKSFLPLKVLFETKKHLPVENIIESSQNLIETVSILNIDKIISLIDSGLAHGFLKKAIHTNTGKEVELLTDLEISKLRSDLNLIKQNKGCIVGLKVKCGTALDPRSIEKSERSSPATSSSELPSLYDQIEGARSNPSLTKSTSFRSLVEPKKSRSVGGGTYDVEGINDISSRSSPIPSPIRKVGFAEEIGSARSPRDSYTQSPRNIESENELRSSGIGRIQPSRIVRTLKDESGIKSPRTEAASSLTRSGKH